MRRGVGSQQRQQHQQRQQQHATAHHDRQAMVLGAGAPVSSSAALQGKVKTYDMLGGGGGGGGFMPTPHIPMSTTAEVRHYYHGHVGPDPAPRPSF
jgi:hypothetical protein